jgi:hypothetical protein
VKGSQASRSVFVTAASPADAAIASELLRRCGLEPYSVFDAPIPYDPATGSFEQIARAAGAVAAVRGAVLPPGVIYELGIGQGLGLPTLVLFLIAADGGLPLLPGDLRGRGGAGQRVAKVPNARRAASVSLARHYGVRGGYCSAS